MRIAVESDGTLEADDPMDRPELERLFDSLAEALVERSPFEADVAMNFETRRVEFFVVVEAENATEAVQKADALVSEAVAAAGLIELLRDEVHARRAELVS